MIGPGGFMAGPKPKPDAPAYTITPARYAKGMKLVRCTPDGSGFKTRAMRLCDFMRGRWTNREGGYVMSPTKATRFERAYKAGWDIADFTKELVLP